MGERVMSKKLTRLILLVIVVLQCGVMLFWASRKAYYYIDEWYTFEYSQSINHRKGDIEYMPLSPQWKNKQWMDVGDLKTRFTLEKGESVFDIPFSKSVGLYALVSTSLSWLFSSSCFFISWRAVLGLIGVLLY